MVDQCEVPSTEQRRSTPGLLSGLDYSYALVMIFLFHNIGLCHNHYSGVEVFTSDYPVSLILHSSSSSLLYSQLILLILA